MGEPKLELDSDEKLDVSEARKIGLKLVLLYGGGFDINIFIQLNSKEKLVKVSPKNEDKQDTLKRFLDKGLKDVYLRPKDYEIFVSHVKLQLAQLKASDELSDDDMAKKLSGGRAVLSSLFKTGSIDDGARDMVKNMAVTSMQMMKSTKVEKIFNKFKNTCTEEYFRSLITAHVACMTLDQFSWSNTQMKEKVSIAAMLCDITLEPGDFVEKRKKASNPLALSSHIHSHPTDAVKIMTSNSFFASSEILEIVKLHHEGPEGKGYPAGIRFGGMKILPAIFIVSNYFVECLLSEDKSLFENPQMAKTKINKTLDDAKQIYKRGNFLKAVDGLYKALLIK